MRRRLLTRVLAATALAALPLATAGTSGAAPALPQGLSSAKATALTMKVSPTVGALALAVQSGVSVAEVRNNLAQSESKSVDLGLIGSSLVSEQCDGTDAAFQEDDIPHGIRVDNRDGDAQVEDAGVPLQGETVSGSYQVVRATTQPLSEAQTTTGQSNLGGLFELRGGRATATTGLLDDGNSREATADVTFDIVIPNVLTLSDVHWHAHHLTGIDRETDAEATFTIGSAQLLGQDVPIGDESGADVLNGLNPVLSQLGVTIHPPVVERLTEPTDLVRVSPMRITFHQSDTGAAVFGPVLDATRQLRDDVANTLIAANCQFATLFLLTEIMIGQMAGTGSMNIDLGGAEALSGFEAGGGLPSFTDAVPDLTVPDLQPVVTTPSATPGSPGSVASPGTPSASVTPTRPSTVATQPIGSFERLCESVHPFKWPACSAGAGPFVGLGGIAAVAGLGFLDWRHQRRRSRAAGQAVTS